MKNFFYSFYAKLSTVFLLLLVILGAAQLIITYESSLKLISTAEQQLNLDLAKHIANELSPILRKEASQKTIKSNIHYLMVYNPRIEIYVLNNKGTIINFFADPKVVKAKGVQLAPIKKFISKSPQNLILGEDPRHPGRKKPFSAARVTLRGGQKGYLYIILSSQRYDSALQMVQNSYIISASLKTLIVILLLTAIAGLVIFRLLTRRLRKRRDAVEAFEQGNYDVRLIDNSQDELGQLAQKFNHMADTIQANMKELRKTDELRRNLIANISHDLRSPLASIQGYLETILIKEERISDQERRRYLDVIMKNTQLLGNLVEELFDLSKLDAHQVEPQMEAFSIAELVQDVIIKLQPRAEQKNISISANLLDTIPPVWADIGLIERVLSNLLENAISYTHPHGKVEVSLIKSQQHVTIKVADNGPGIATHELPHIFDRFHRVDKSRSIEHGNTGLGLAIAQKILDLHTAEIQVQSEKGKGTQFSFDLPFHHPDK